MRLLLNSRLFYIVSVGILADHLTLNYYLGAHPTGRCINDDVISELCFCIQSYWMERNEEEIELEKEGELEDNRENSFVVALVLDELVGREKEKSESERREIGKDTTHAIDLPFTHTLI